MLKHIVMYQLIDNTPSNRQAISDMLLSMKGKIDVLLDIEVGSDIVCSQRSFDLCLICTFSGKQELDQYTVHPIHLPVVEYLKPKLIKSVSVDYII